MEWISYVAAVAPGDSAEHDHRKAGERHGPGAVLLEVLQGNHDVLTFRYTAGGKGVGEVWFRTEAEARQAIAAEYLGRLGQWERVPASAPDPHAYAIAYARATLSPPEA